ncbi:MAG: carbohydrate ABC transporter permease [Bacillota bacterium]|nr:carbohydrate ABC transporter permease [Bacillota bacterium]
MSSEKLRKKANYYAEAKQKGFRSYISSLINLAIGCIIVFPIFYAFMGGFKNDAVFDQYPPTILPQSFAYLENFNTVLFHSYIPRFMLNSLIIAGIGTLIRLIIGTMAAFSFSFFDYAGKKFLFFAVLGTMMIPGDALLISNYLTVTHMHLRNTYMGIMIVYFVSATHIFMFRQNFMTISGSLREASMIDGCGSFRFYTQICVPVSKPVITSLGISSFVGLWNAYLWPLLVTDKPMMRTVQVGITMLSFPENPSKAPVFAGIAIILIPSIFIFLFFQRNLVRGITAGSVTG